MKPVIYYAFTYSTQNPARLLGNGPGVPQAKAFVALETYQALADDLDRIVKESVSFFEQLNAAHAHIIQLETEERMKP